MAVICVFLVNLLFVAALNHDDSIGYCDASTKICEPNNHNTKKLIFYDVNPPEGFNLRRDVYMRFAIMLTEAQNSGRKKHWQLVLPPWYRLFHWKNSRHQHPWGAFFDVNSLKSYAPVVEMYEVFSDNPKLIIDRLYILQNYEDAFENGVFTEKWEVTNDCYYDESYWGYKNITVKETICVKFQGKVSKLWEIISLHPKDEKVMFSHGEIPLHNSYGTKSYWDCRKSMKFNNKLVTLAKNYISKTFNCDTNKCTSYLAIHWRRKDFLYGRQDLVPSVKGTAKQIYDTVKKNNLKLDSVYVATDASMNEIDQLKVELNELGFEVNFFIPTADLDIGDGGLAVIDQIICSHSAFFIGTHESTFSFRIQEEREIIGFDSKTTFNRLCPDKGKCERPSIWKIVH